VTIDKPIEEYRTVGVWFEDYKRQWAERAEDLTSRLDVLRRFCEFVGRDPDTIIRECLRTSEGQTKISIKGRRFYDEKIREFQEQVEGDARLKVHCGNTVRSFLIHNGIFLQSGVQLG
jgi:hypothetical protein